MNKLLASTLALGLAAAIASPLMAQTANPSATTGAAQGTRQQQAPRAFSTSGERIEARLAYIKTALKITDAQQSQWNAFADTLRKQAASRDKQMQDWRGNGAQRPERTQATSVERLERQQQFLTIAAARLNEQLTVQKPLYAVLTAEQKQVADQLLSPRGRHGHGQPRNRGMHRMAA